MKKSMFIFLTIILAGLVFLSACGTDNNDSNEKEEDENEVEEEQDEELETETESESESESETDTETDSTDVDEDTDDAASENEEEEKDADEITENETDQEENNEEEQTDDTDTEPKVVLENDAFRIYEPTPNAVVGNEFTVRGEAKVSEAMVMYEFEDGHNILDEGNVMASQGAPEWGEFEITIKFDEVAYDTGTVILYEESQKDGSRVNQLYIPVSVEK